MATANRRRISTSLTDVTPGSGPEPGTPGSGVLPDLKVHFEFNSAKLTPEATAQLDELGQVLQREALRPYRFRISGHTNSVGSAKYNEWLSQQRASAVEILSCGSRRSRARPPRGNRNGRAGVDRP